MKKIGAFGKLLFFINSIAAVLLLLGYILPYVPPHIFPKLSVLSLLIPVLLGVNLLFFAYWLLRLKRKMILSALVLLLGFGHLTAFFHFGGSQTENLEEGFSIMTYNVHSFTQDGEIPRLQTESKMKAFLRQESPAVLCLQEYHPSVSFSEMYPYQYAKMTNRKKTFGQIIYSKFPIFSSGSIDFPKSGNNAIYADIVIKKDTLRIYNMHFQSFNLKPSFSDLQEEDSKRLLGRMGDAFQKQEEQLNLFLTHEKASTYTVIVAGDFNNSASSYVYRKTKGEKVDAFAKAGSGTGKTFTFDFLPLRIDFILADPSWEVLQFKNYDIELSDHFPILARLRKAVVIK
ncbi:MAG: vancomycin resistance protein VanJ [Flavobacteriales bacterium]|jgi:endonuclease/exonuclease/phosphatase family metal-dependent hydrolase